MWYMSCKCNVYVRHGVFNVCGECGVSVVCVLSVVCVVQVVHVRVWCV